MHSINLQPVRYRVTSIDLVRGMIMIIMALDHTRDYFHVTAMTSDPLNAATTTPALFFTRWITHFCAPVFVLLSGTSAFLSAQNKDAATASAFLIKRGFWLILMELTIVTFGLTFNPFFSFILLQVIWAIGCSMVLLGIIIRISAKAVLIIGIMLVAGHNALDYITVSDTGAGSVLLKIFLTARGTILPIGSSHVIGAFYAILPWTGVMFIGYGIGSWFAKGTDARLRKKRLLLTGSLVIILFFVMRILRRYGDPGAWDGNSLYSFLNTSKYPPSLQFLCMTLGPAMLLLAFTENIKAAWADKISVYGKTPFFYFVVHFYLLHLLVVIVFFATGHGVHEIVDPQSIFLFRPQIFGFSLPIVYAIWLAVVLALYYPCKWFYKYKRAHTQWWLKYV